MGKSKASKICRAVLFAATGMLFCYFCLSENNLFILIQTLPKLQYFWLFCAFACVVLSWIMEALAVRVLVTGACGGRYGFWRAFRVTMVGQYFNAITPYSLAGQPMQLLTLVRQGVPSGIAVSALVRKFLVYQTSAVGYSLTVLLLRYRFFQNRFPGFMALALIGFLYQAVVVLLLVLFAYRPNVTHRIIQGSIWLLTKLHIVKNPEETGTKVNDQLLFYLENNRAMKGNHRLKVRLYGYTFLQLTALFVVPFFIYKTFHSPGFPVLDMVAAQCFVTMISAFTPLPGAVGAAEGSFLVLFQIFFSGAVIRQAMLLWRLIAYCSCITVGAFFVGTRRRSKMDFAPPQPENEPCRKAQNTVARKNTVKNGGSVK